MTLNYFKKNFRYYLNLPTCENFKNIRKTTPKKSKKQQKIKKVSSSSKFISPSEKVLFKNFCHDSECRLKCVYVNAGSLNNKMLELEARLSELKFPEILGVSETWFDRNSLTNLDNYQLFRRDRNKSNCISVKEGGVCIYVKCDLCAMEIADEQLNSEACEQVWCGLKIGSDSILIGYI